MADDIQGQRLQNYLDAEQKALNGQEWQSGGKRVRRPDLNSLNTGINQLLSNTTAVRSKQIILRDL
ncbi:hypothetical protein [Pectinatus frisingensis]|uniref:hypothetical protein n=1 Tax=Pectinatus frisingensis TaxID=865 RepID=UPI0018C5B6AA|nr:hypothetical protein [Pectinatus frisingensis]